MNPDQKASGPFSVFLIIMMVVGGVFLQSEVDLRGSRPLDRNLVHHHPEAEQDVDARLWQDPFQAVYQFKESEKKFQHGEHEGHSQDHLTRFKEGLKRRIQQSGSGSGVHILGVMVSNGPYFDDAENRIRTRYAVVSGLAGQNYVPVSSAYIGFLNGEDLMGTSGHHGHNHGTGHFPQDIPYEWFELKGNSKDHANQDIPKYVLVLWLEDHPFFHEYPKAGVWGKRPVEQLTLLYRRLMEDPDAPGHKSKVIGNNKVPFLLLGPTTSTGLMAMVEEIDGCHRESMPLFPFKIYSTRATKDEDLILKPVQQATQDQAKTNKSQMTIQDLFLRNTGGAIHFLRTTPTDYSLAQALVKELTLRGLNKSSNIALVSEWDTDYGRAFKQTVCKAWRNFDWKNRNPKSSPPPPSGDFCQKLSNIKHYSYLRGLDGRIPETERNRDEEPPDLKKSLTGEVDSEAYSNQKAERQRRFDYLIRLGETMRADEKKFKSDDKGFGGAFQKAKFDAIGVLGSDYYDKMLVLQGLRDSFRSAWFFTTDLDARLLHKSDYRYARNLIVASGYGLQLHPDLQKEFPPFRDNYQTSAYLATQLALKEGNSAASLNQVTFDTCATPRVFERGRTQAVPLDFQDSGNKQVSCLQMKQLLGLREKTETREFHIEPYIFPGSVYLLLVGLLLQLLRVKKKEDLAKPYTQDQEIRSRYKKDFFWLSRIVIGYTALMFFGIFMDVVGNQQPYFFPHSENIPSLLTTYKYLTGGVLVFAMLVFICIKWLDHRREIAASALIFVSFGLFVGYLDSKGGEESLYFLEGVSIWPTDILRLVGAMVACLGIWYYYHIQRRDWKKLRVDFPRPQRDTVDEDIWNVFCEKFYPDNYWWKIFWRTSVFLAVVFWAMAVFDFPFTPVRGPLSFILDKTVLTVYVLSFSTVLFFVGVRLDGNLEILKAFEKAYEQPNPLVWDPQVVKRIFDPNKLAGLEHKLESPLLNGMVTLRYLGDRTHIIDQMIAFPLIVLAISMVARARIFDAWDTPFALGAMVLYVIFYILIKSSSIRSRAQKLKRKIMDQLKDQQVFFKLNNQANDVELIELLIEDTENYKKGTFLPLMEQPMFKSLLYPASGFGAMALLEFLIYSM